MLKTPRELARPVDFSVTVGGTRAGSGVSIGRSLPTASGAPQVAGFFRQPFGGRLDPLFKGRDEF